MINNMGEKDLESLMVVLLGTVTMIMYILNYVII
jgi:hypothetical protein